MKLTKFNDASLYYQNVEKYLLKHEAANCLILGIAKGLSSGEINFANSPYLAVIENNQTIVATGIQTSPRKVILAKSGNIEAIRLIAEDLATNSPSLPGVIAPKAEAESFIKTWKTLTENSSKLEVAMRIHQLEKVESINKALGNLRIATESDRSVLTDWVQAFETEALGNNEPKSDHQLWFDRHLKNKSLYVWQDNNTVTSMAACGGTTANGIRINAVYTPTEYRGKGYATSCVAEMSKELLNQYKYCFLFTDLANPTSNHIYRKIGYVPMENVSNYVFD
jgi:uncharacterized protein